MTFNTEIKADLDAIVADVFGETIRYKADGGPWVSISAFVENERQDLDTTAGASVHGRIGPIFVTVSKTDVASVVIHKDVVEFSEREYTVILIDTQDAAGWRLYCVR